MHWVIVSVHAVAALRKLHLQTAACAVLCCGAANAMAPPPNALSPMHSLSQQRTHKYLHARQQHPAWLLLASRRAPLMLSCLEALFEHQPGGVAFDCAVQALADLLAAHANQPDFEIDTADIAAQARRELRDWIRRALVTEREGRIFETDALKTALRFVAQLDHRLMTSTASRLAVVQREIDNLASALDPDPHSRANHIERRIEDLQQQLGEVRAGRLPVQQPIKEAKVVQGVRARSEREVSQFLKTGQAAENQRFGQLLNSIPCNRHWTLTGSARRCAARAHRCRRWVRRWV